jgi:hypothetical protein
MVRHLAVVGEPEPDIEVLLEYLTNMVYALELLLKVMSNNWKNHDVGGMYEQVFGKPHDSPELMDVLERAVCDQKFLFEPADGLVDHLPELEKLWYELQFKFDDLYFQANITVQHGVKAPPEFVQYLRDHLRRYLLAEGRPIVPPIPREQRVQRLRHMIQTLQDQLERVENGEEPPEETVQQQLERIDSEHAQRLEDAENCFDGYLRYRPHPLQFVTISPGKMVPGWLDDPW